MTMPFSASWILRPEVDADVKEFLAALTGRNSNSISDSAILANLMPTVDESFWTALLTAFENFHIVLSQKDRSAISTVSDLVGALSQKIHEKYATVAMLAAFPPDVTPVPSYISGTRQISKDITDDSIMGKLAGRMLQRVQTMLPTVQITALFLVPPAFMRMKWTWSKVLTTIVSDVQQFEVGH